MGVAFAGARRRGQAASSVSACQRRPGLILNGCALMAEMRDSRVFRQGELEKQGDAVQCPVEERGTGTGGTREGIFGPCRIRMLTTKDPGDVTACNGQTEALG